VYPYNSPIKSRLAGYTKNRLKRSSFVHEDKKLDRKFAPELTIPTTPLSRRDILDPLTNDLSGIKVKLDITQLESGKQEWRISKKVLRLP
jgi:hypothetical protein